MLFRRSRSVFLNKGESNKLCSEITIGGDWEKSVEVLDTQGKATFLTHLIQVRLTLTWLTWSCRVLRIIDRMVQLMKQGPAHVKRPQGGFVTDQMIKVRKVDQHHKDLRRIVRQVFPFAGSDSGKNNVSSPACVFNDDYA